MVSFTEACLLQIFKIPFLFLCSFWDYFGVQTNGYWDMIIYLRYQPFCISRLVNGSVRHVLSVRMSLDIFF